MSLRTRLVGLTTLLAAAAAPARADLVSGYVSMALQGDLSGAAAHFEQADSLSPAETRCFEEFRRRFVQAEEDLAVPDDPFVGELVHTYRDYWRRALLGEIGEGDAEAFLTGRISELLARHGIASDVGGDEALERMGDGIARAGLHHLGGMTRPHFDLMLWSRQDTTRYDVELTDGRRTVTVVGVGDFLVRGWSEFATIGRASNGGWAKSEALFCLVDDYDLESENFRVSYLQHETRHFADYELFPALDQIELEYRAKLTECAFAVETLPEILASFASRAERNPAAPHSFANEAVVRHLSRELFGEDFVAVEGRWREVAPDRIHATARELLARNTRALRNAGAETTRGVIGGERSGS
ncbi:MAG: hypothetical protein ACT4PE_05375 [Candidatus Eiseniibacteriota bacterium]